MRTIPRFTDKEIKKLIKYKQSTILDYLNNDEYWDEKRIHELREDVENLEKELQERKKEIKKGGKNV